MLFLSPYILYIAVFIISLGLSYISIPRINYISKKKKLYDKPDNIRKIHVKVTPNLGGVGIFFAFIIACSIFISPAIFDKWNFIVASSVILFVTGIQDDLNGLTPKTKFLAQFLAAIITVWLADIRISSLHGILGIEELPIWISVLFTTIGCMFVTNAMNLIDGIDGLAGSIGVLCTVSLGLCLAAVGNVGGACIAFGLMGAILGFLYFNISPAQIFMGDTGSLLLGYIISILSILLVHSYNYNSGLVYVIHSHKAVMIVTLSILFVPVFDSFRVFINRARKGGSPFKADRTHLHHFLLDAGFTHNQAVTILITANILIITIALIVQDLDPNLALLSIIVVAGLLFVILFMLRKKKMAKNLELIEQRNKAINNSKDLPEHVSIS